MADRVSSAIVTIAYIGLGSNLGNSLQILQDGWKELGDRPGISLVRLSSPYRTEPVGMDSFNWFINAAGSLSTTLAPKELLNTLLDIEAHFGRKRDHGTEGCLDRILDFDLLMYGRQVQKEEGLELPHPHMHNRLFVLGPLCEIAPDVKHPGLMQTIQELYAGRKNDANAPAVEKINWREQGG